ncbi:MAG TPA: rod shape-determining protein RodA [Acidiphilium sp.]|nr:MAG: rod shape-determining protein RodA [Acidiphilium sp. 21-60-14]OYV90460.1 MAG: rod shape-determining protein RodA [Acidiphilium sp. 37-60-79]HQT87731.1 rod shape-determining protein RodA [Acidiphilium sp.]HQU22858.1 rod shape-determining protein RodA [Acidiphilium sp.]
MSGFVEYRPYYARSFGLVRKLLRINWLFVLACCALAGIGYAALYSAAGGHGEPYATPQLIRFSASLIMMIAIALVDIRLIAKLAWPAYALGLVLLVVVWRFGHVGLGAKRWIDVGGLHVQPSELMKLFLALALAAWFQRANYERVGQIPFLIPPIMAILVPAALILKEPNLGTAVITMSIGGTILLGAGVRWWKFAIVIAVVAVAAPFIYHHLHGYQKQRILTFLHPGRDPLGAGYNIIQSKIALGSGGFWGQGFLHGTQNQLNFLPEKQTDFVFTIIAEEFGFADSMVLITVLFSMIAMGFYTALRCQHMFGRLAALGISTNLFLYCFVNLAMVMGLIPVGGVPLPLVSYGGSALTAVMLGFGVLMSIHVHRDVEFGVSEE